MTDFLPLTAQAWTTWALIVVVGSMVGSFLNVCIYRLPREESVVRPRSRCPGCQTPIAWYDNVPLLSYALLRARCRHCRASISWRYPVVELLTALVTVAVFARFGFQAVTYVYAAFLYALIVASFVDLEFQIIPDEISVGGLVVGVGLSVLIPALHATDARLPALGWSVVGVLTGGGILYITGMIGDFIFRKESMGGGDIKLLAMAGSILGWKAVLITFFISPIMALLPGLYVLFFKRSHIIPYGPFLSLGLVLSLFAGDVLMRVSGMEDTFRIMWEYYNW